MGEKSSVKIFPRFCKIGTHSSVVCPACKTDYFLGQ